MQETFFIADLHLAPEKPATIFLCLKFLAGRAQQASALYILGDLFEVWLGDDNDEPVYQDVLTALHNLTQRGVPVFVMHGNRDFLLGKGFVNATGCQLIPDPSVIDLYGVPTLLMHGDALCTLDTDYQAFRQQVRNPQWQQQFLAQPLSQRRILAQQARIQSKKLVRTKAEAVMDVTLESVIFALETHKVYHLIHGHTHKPAIHQFTYKGHAASRKVVGDWRDESAMVLRCTPSDCQLYQVLGIREAGV